MTSTAVQAYEAHVAALATKDVEAVVAGYAEDAILASNTGIGRGHDYVRSVFAPFLAAEDEIVPETQVFEQDDVVYVTWTAAGAGRSLSGADTFVIRDGLIAVHSGFIAAVG